MKILPWFLDPGYKKEYDRQWKEFEKLFEGKRFRPNMSLIMILEEMNKMNDEIQQLRGKDD